MSNCTRTAGSRLRSRERGFTLVEMIVVTLLLLIAMVGLLAVFDAGARINKNETDVADAQGSVRYGIYQMTRVIRMAGSGGLYVTQAVLNHADKGLSGLIPANSGFSYDNVSGVSVIDQTGTRIRVRDGTDMIEIRGVVFSPLLGFDQQTGCGGCTSSADLTVLPITGDPVIGQHVNNDATQRPQFASIDAYTAGATAAEPMLVVVMDGNSDLHTGCSDPLPNGSQRFPQPAYNVGVLAQPTRLVSSNTFGPVDFGASLGQHFNAEMPSIGTTEPPVAIQKVRRAGVLDDVLFFIGLQDTNTDPQGLHPFLAQGIRRGDHFQVTILADDVEDMQVAYGVDLNGDFAVNRGDFGCGPDPVADPDADVSNQIECDEWRPNAGVGTDEPVFAPEQFQSQDPFAGGHSGSPPAAHCPRLHAVMISLLAKARDADPTYKGPTAQGYKLMNHDLTTFPLIPGQYRRRVQTLRVNLRNYAFQG